MEDRTTWTPLGGPLALLVQPAALIAALVLVAAHFSRSFAIMGMIASAREGNPAMLGMVQILASVVMFAVFAAVHFLLSRRLGGTEGSAGEPGYGPWFGLMFAYFLVSYLSTAAIANALSALGFGYDVLPLIMGVVGLAVRLVFFPILVFLAGQAHDSKAGGLGEIGSFLVMRGIGWTGGYVVLAVILTLAPLVLIRFMGAAGAMPGGAGMLIHAIIAGLGQLLTIVYVIAACRAFREGGKGGDGLIF